MLRGTAAYAAGSIIQRSIGFLLLPVYARVLEPPEYGQLGIIVTVTTVVGILLSLGLETAVFRNVVYLADKPDERNRFLNTVVGFGLLVPPIVAALVAIPVSMLAEAAFAIPQFPVVLGVLAAGLSASTTIGPAAIMRAEERLGDYLRLSLTQVVGGATLPFLFVVVLGLGVSGWMLASTIAALISLGAGTALVRHKWSLDVDPKYLKAALSFALPMVPHAISHWALALSDRAVLGSMLPASEVGVYFIAYQFSLPIGVMSVALAQSVQPMYATAATSDAKREQLGPSATVQALAIAYLTMVVALLGPAVVHAILPPTYIGAASFIPWIALGTGLFGLYLIPMNAITLLAGQNRWVWVVTLGAGLANIALNLVFVPEFGAMAAAVNTTVGYAILLVGIYVYMRKVCQPPVKYEFLRIGVGMAVIAGSCVLVSVLSPADPQALDLLVRGAAAVAVGVGLTFWGVRPRDVLDRISTQPPGANG